MIYKAQLANILEDPKFNLFDVDQDYFIFTYLRSKLIFKFQYLIMVREINWQKGL